MQRTILSPVVVRTAAPQPAADPIAALALLALAMAGKGQGRRPPKRTPDQRRMRAMTLEAFCRDVYAPAKSLRPGSRALALGAVAKLRKCLGRDARVGEGRSRLVDRFRDWLAGQVTAGAMAGTTANCHLRYLRAIINYAAKRRAVKRLPTLEFLPEPESEVEAWAPEDLARIEAQTRTFTGSVGQVPAAIWWTAWALVISRIGCRVGAMMAATREDYSRGVLLLRAEHQKQKRDQRLALPPRAAAAVERLLESHQEAILFPWPHDPHRPDEKRNFKTLFAHFRKRILGPCGLTLPRGVRTRQFRRTVATLLDDVNGDARKQLGHASERTTKRYKDRRKTPVCTEALLIPDTSARQMELF